VLVELSRSADWWEFQATPAALDADTLALEWSSRQDVREVGPRRPVRRSVRDGPGGTARGVRCTSPRLRGTGGRPVGGRGSGIHEVEHLALSDRDGSRARIPPPNADFASNVEFSLAD